jgi:hypothetical protein
MEKDYTCNKAHAQELVDNLRAYWKMRGFSQYKFWLKKIVENRGDTSKAYVRYEVDSDIVIRAPRLDEI